MSLSLGHVDKPAFRARTIATPAPVLAHAQTRPFLSTFPSRMVASYWNHHPVRADRLARSLATLSGTPTGWQWRVSARGDGGLPSSFRMPPAPFREEAFRRGPGHCCICGQPVFRFGWHVDLWADGEPNRRAAWHACCVAAWKLWTAPAGQAAFLRRLQRRRCKVTDRRLLRTAEIDHELPLFQVWRDHRTLDWPRLLAFWGFPNLQVINRAVHTTKCAAEAIDRASVRSRVAGLPSDLRSLPSDHDDA